MIVSIHNSNYSHNLQILMIILCCVQVRCSKTNWRLIRLFSWQIFSYLPSQSIIKPAFRFMHSVRKVALVDRSPIPTLSSHLAAPLVLHRSMAEPHAVASSMPMAGDEVHMNPELLQGTIRFEKTLTPLNVPNGVPNSRCSLV